MLVHKSRGPRGWAGANALKVNGFANPFMEILRHGLKGTQTLDWFVTLICVSASLTFFCYTTIWCHLAVFKKQLISNVWSIEFIGSINRIAIYGILMPLACVHSKADLVWFTLSVIFELQSNLPVQSTKSGNQFDVADNLSPDWQENSFE